MGSFQNKHVLITGASSGIGEALAYEFAERGARLTLLARRRDRLDEVSQKLLHRHPQQKTFTAVADVTSDESLHQAFEESVLKNGPLDVVVANAGFSVAGNVSELTIDDYRRQFETNIFGVLRTVKEAIPSLVTTRGRLVVVGSVNGYVALPGISAYAMSKFSIRAFCNALYHEMLPLGISVTHIAPGFVVSEIRRVNNRGQFKQAAKDPIPLWLQMESSTAAKKIVQSIYRRKRERVLTGHGWWVVILSRFFPGLTNLLIRIFKIKARSEPHP